MATEQQNILVKLTARYAEFVRGMKKSQDSLRATGEQFDKVRNRAALFTAGMTLVGRSAVNSFAGFEASVTRAAVIASKGGQTFGSTMDDMGAKALETAGKTEFSAAQIGDAFTFMAMAGLDAQTAIASMDDVTKLATAANTDLAKSADIVTNIMSAFSKEARDLNSVNNALVGTFTNSNTSIEEIAEGMKKAGPTANSLGVELEEVSALLGVLGNNGIKAEEAGTGIRNMMLRLLKPSRGAAKSMESLGISMEMLRADGLVGIISQLEKVRGQTDNFEGKIAEIFETRAAPQVLALLNSGTDAVRGLQEAIADAQNTDLVTSIQEKQLGAMAGQLKILESAWESLKIQVGEEVAPAITKVAQSATRFIASLDKDDIKEFGATLKSLFVGGVAITGFATMAGLATKAAVAINAAKAATGGLAAVFGSSMAPALLAIGAGLLSFNATLKAYEFVTGRAVSVADVFADVLETLTTKGQGAGEVIAQIAGTIGNMLGPGIVRAIPGLGTLYGGLVDITNIGGLFSDKIDEIGDSIQGAFGDAAFATVKKFFDLFRDAPDSDVIDLGENSPTFTSNRGTPAPGIPTTTSEAAEEFRAKLEDARAEAEGIGDALLMDARRLSDITLPPELREANRIRFEFADVDQQITDAYAKLAGTGSTLLAGAISDQIDGLENALKLKQSLAVESIVNIKDADKAREALSNLGGALDLTADQIREAAARIDADEVTLRSSAIESAVAGVDPLSGVLESLRRYEDVANDTIATEEQRNKLVAASSRDVASAINSLPARFSALADVTELLASQNESAAAGMIANSPEVQDALERLRDDARDAAIGIVQLGESARDRASRTSARGVIDASGIRNISGDSQFLKSVEQSIVNSIDGQGLDLSPVTGMIGKKIGGVLDSFVGQVGEFSALGSEIGKAAGPMIASGVSAIFSAIVDTIKGAAQQVIDGTRQVFDASFGAFKSGRIGEVTGRLQDLVGGVASAGMGVATLFGVINAAFIPLGVAVAAATAPLTLVGGASLIAAQQTETFGKVLKSMDAAIEPVIAAFEPLARGLFAIPGIISTVTSALGPFFAAMGENTGIAKVLFESFKQAAMAGLLFGQGMVNIFNALNAPAAFVADLFLRVASGLQFFSAGINLFLVDLQLGIAQLLGNVPGMDTSGQIQSLTEERNAILPLLDESNNFSELSDAITESIIGDIDGSSFADAISSLSDLTYEEAVSLGESLGVIGDNLDSFGESLLNAPEAFSVTAARFAAADREGTFGTGGADLVDRFTAVGQGLAGLVVNGDIYVDAPDTDAGALAESIKAAAQEAQAQQTGSALDSAVGFHRT